MGELSHLVQRGRDWVGCGPAQSLPRCTKCNILPINSQCTNHCIVYMMVRAVTVLLFLFPVRSVLAASVNFACCLSGAKKPQFWFPSVLGKNHGFGFGFKNCNSPNDGLLLCIFNVASKRLVTSCSLVQNC